MVSGEIMYSIIKDIADSWWKSDLIRCCFSHLFCEHNKFLLVAAFLRNERMHPNFVLACLQAQEIINVLQRLQIGCSSSFSVASGFVHLLCHSCSLLWLFSLFLIFWVFLWTGFSLWLNLTKKGMQSQCRLDWVFFGWVKTNYIIAKHVCTRWFAFLIIHNCSFAHVVVNFWFWTVPGLLLGCKMMRVCYITGATVVCSVHEHDIELMLSWINLQLGAAIIISLAIFWLHLLS